jgi:hypothetical protein
MPDLRDTRTPKTACPYCRHKLDAAMAADPKHPDAAPSSGDFSVCISCASVLVFDDELKSRAPKPGELEAALLAHPEMRAPLRQAQDMVRQLDRRELRNV